MANEKTMKLIELARMLAGENPEFQAVLGPGGGDKATGKFMRDLRERALAELGTDYSEKRVCGQNSLAVDFYIPEEQTVIEVALGLPNPSSEFEKDILKAIMARETGEAVTRLVFISRAGAAKKCCQPGRTAVKSWAKAKHGLDIEVHDLQGEARVRRRVRDSST
jgi:hypothetical protein